MENFSWKTVKLDCITIAEILRCFRTSGCRKSRNRFKNKKFLVLSKYFEQQTNCYRCRRKMSQSRRSPSWKNQAYLPFLSKQMETMPNQSVRFIPQFSLEIYIQFWKYFHSMILGRLGRCYCKKNRMLEFLAKTFS